MSAVRHPVSMMVRAQELRDAGWATTRIGALLAREFGCPAPSVNTIWCWVQPGARDRQTAAQRAQQRRDRAAAASFSFPGRRSPQWKLGRLRALRGQGLSLAAIAGVMRLDFGDELSTAAIREAVEQDKLPRVWRTA
ncbi:MAG TPA: hypothetical protein VFS59_11640 [Gemmatimonadaceae bacterium]|nr:hypothetical protein [Gemmatimonadaceae bacterium]